MRIPENISQETYCQLWLTANQQRFTKSYSVANIPIIVYQQVFCPSTELTYLPFLGIYTKPIDLVAIGRYLKQRKPSA